MVLQSLPSACRVELGNIWPPGLPQTCTTHFFERKKNSGLVPELRQMFVEISGDFLVFFLQGKKRKEGKFLYRMSSGCSAITPYL